MAPANKEHILLKWNIQISYETYKSGKNCKKKSKWEEEYELIMRNLHNLMNNSIFKCMLIVYSVILI